ncbi:MAG: DMT family transporter [Cyanobacteria bacterium P01_D01_bin.116]
MANNSNKPTNLIKRLPASLFLWIAVIIFGAANAITKRLTEIGAENLMDGRNPISFCNVLFVGNVCAALVLFFIYGRQLHPSYWQHLSKKDWLSLIGVSILSGALAPALIFEGLARTQATNVVLISRIEPPLVLALSFFILGERVNLLQVIGAVVSFIGICTIVLLQTFLENMMTAEGFLAIGLGELLTAIGAISSAIATILSKKSLDNITPGFYSLFRTVLGGIIFFFVALFLYGPNHFTDVFSPLLWQWMLLYGAVIVALGQSFWFIGLEGSPSFKISLAASFIPISGIVAAFFVLGEVPTLAQYIGGSIVILGIVISQFGISKQKKRLANREKLTKSMDNEVGFKGI